MINNILIYYILQQASDFTDIGDWPTLGPQGEVSFIIELWLHCYLSLHANDSLI